MGCCKLGLLLLRGLGMAAASMGPVVQEMGFADTCSGNWLDLVLALAWAHREPVDFVFVLWSLACFCNLCSPERLEGSGLLKDS